MSSVTSKSSFRLGILLLIAACTVAVTVSRVVHSGEVPHFAAGHPPLSPVLSIADRQRVRQLLLSGVGTSVSLPIEGAQQGQVQASVDSVRDFIRSRSGLELVPEVTAKLKTIEQRTLDGNASRISCDDLSDSVLGVLVERFRRCSDAEIEQAADGLGNVRSEFPPGTASSVAAPNDVMLRASGQGIMTRSEFVETAKRYRTLMNAPTELVVIISIVRPVVRQAFQQRLSILSQALPEQWGDAPERGLTPNRAFLLAYSVVGDDPLARSAPELQASIKWLDSVNADGDPKPPGSEGRLAYGSKGRVFSSPLDLVFTKQTSMRLLDKIAERTSK